MAQFLSPAASAAIFVAGPYNVTLGGVSLGLMRGGEQSPMVEIQRHNQPIDNTHLWGRTRVGAITLGGSAFANLIMMEYLTGANAVVWPYTTFGTCPPVGAEEYDTLCAALVFTAALGTTAAGKPATLTATKAIIAEDFAVRYSLGPILREVPLRFVLMPTGAAGASTLAFTPGTFWQIT